MLSKSIPFWSGPLGSNADVFAVAPSITMIEKPAVRFSPLMYSCFDHDRFIGTALVKILLVIFEAL